MTQPGIHQAVEVLRIHLATLSSNDRGAEASALVNLVYQDRLNTPPLDQRDPAAALDQACQRFSDILEDHLLLATILLGIAAQATGRTAEQILDSVIRRDPPEAG